MPKKSDKNLWKKCTKKVILKQAKSAAKTVINATPFIGVGIGAAYGVIDNTSLISFSPQIPTLSNVLIPAAAGGLIGLETRSVAKKIIKNGPKELVNGLPLLVGTVCMIGNEQLNQNADVESTLLAGAGGIMATKAIAVGIKCTPAYATWKESKKNFATICKLSKQAKKKATKISLAEAENANKAKTTASAVNNELQLIKENLDYNRFVVEPNPNNWSRFMSNQN